MYRREQPAQTNFTASEAREDESVQHEPFRDPDSTLHVKCDNTKSHNMKSNFKIKKENYLKKIYISHTALADALGWSENDLRIVRRCTACPVPPRRRGRNFFEVEGTLAWLESMLPRIEPALELKIRNAATAPEGTPHHV